MATCIITQRSTNTHLEPRLRATNRPARRHSANVHTCRWTKPPRREPQVFRNAPSTISVREIYVDGHAAQPSLHDVINETAPASPRRRAGSPDQNMTGRNALHKRRAPRRSRSTPETPPSRRARTSRGHVELGGHAPVPTGPRPPSPRVRLARERRRSRPPPNQTRNPTAPRIRLRTHRTTTT